MIQVWNNQIRDSEVSALCTAVSKRQIMEGAILKEFEKETALLTGKKYAIGVTSGTAALALSLMAIGIQPGDEVIVPDLTFIATANAACILGAKVIVAPTEKVRPILDLESVDHLVTPKTKAIMPVALNGRIACSKELKRKYSKRGIYIIEDACQAFLSSNDEEIAGTEADIGCFSFGMTKVVTSVMGGLAVTDNEELYERMKIIKTQGMPSIFEGNEYSMPGFNFKFPDVLASIGLKQLERAEEKVLHVKKIDEIYRDNLKNVEGISFLERKNDGFAWMTDILCENRNKVRKVLADNHIISRPLTAPLHSASYLVSEGDYKNSVSIQKRTLYLPGGPDQSFENIEKVIDVLRGNCLI